MSEINVKIRLGAHTLYDIKVSIELEENILALKKKIREKCPDLVQSGLEILYCGSIMEDDETLIMHDLFNGATVHAFKKIKHEPMPTTKYLNDSDLAKLGIAFRSLSLNSAYRRALLKLTKPEVINNLIMTTPGLSRDPVGLTLLQHSELLVKLGDYEVMKRISRNHPALASAALHIAAAVHEDVIQNHSIPDILSRNMLNNGSDEDEDMDDSSSTYDADNGLVAAMPSFGTITPAQLASAIASVTTQQPQPSTSGASTSTGNARTTMANINDVQNQSFPSTLNLTTQLNIMREMGLTNDAINRQALIIGTNLETAIELVLSGFSSFDGRNNV